MYRLAAIGLLAIALAGCGGGNPTAGGSTATSTPAPSNTPIPPAKATPVTRRTSVSPPAQPTPTVVVNAGYLAFVNSICRALSSHDTSSLTSDLPYYQYNTGLRYGMLGDGEGQTGDPSLFTTWLQGANVRCVKYTADIAGHGVLLTRGWSQPAPWSLVELDTFNGTWKINDFTFGGEVALSDALKTTQPVLRYRGV